MATQAHSSRKSEHLITAGDQPMRFIKLGTVKTLTTLSTSEIYRRIASGRFPKQVMLGPKSVVWIEAEVIAWCDSLIASRVEAA
ncbi:AlpA family phage regulatory protein [Pseudomonas sp. MCal1]|uniref:helix-turn-helix transcriptional regulator n=1 Tax=Pseudomonas sp. MCal1 TaxID=2919887 RepID=UPI002251C8EF|nr:AlpA family phage regulatory protein [Pseudomonas sp. MCal1]MCX4218739.1 AlpA family phage regulatory protein [Pseudomonas sp. MCal1]